MVPKSRISKDFHGTLFSFRVQARGCLSCDRPCALFPCWSILALSIHVSVSNQTEFFSFNFRYNTKAKQISVSIVDSMASLIFLADTQAATSPLSPATNESDAVSSSSVSKKLSLFQESAPTALAMLSTKAS